MLDQNNHPIGRYFYDGEGRRVRKVTDLETTVFVYDASSKLIAEYSNQTPENPNTSYVATDTLLSVRLVTDKSGNVVSRRDFQPFGEELTADGSARKSTDKYSASTQDKVRQRFTGYQKDIETGLDFAEARMYENRHGRFTAVDPLLASGKSANPQTFNRYTYVLNSPLVNTDPTGLQTAQRFCSPCTPATRPREDGEIGLRVFLPGEEIPSDYTPVTAPMRFDGASGRYYWLTPTSSEQYIAQDEPNPIIGRLLNGFPANPWEQAATGLGTGISNAFTSTANLLTEVGVRANNGFMPTFTPNPLYIQPYGCSGSINCNWQAAGTAATYVGPGVAAGVFRAGATTTLGLVSESSNPLQFSQTTASLTRARFEVGPNGIAVPTSKAELIEGLQNAGFKSYPNVRTIENGINFVNPSNGNVYRIMDGSRFNPPRLITHSGIGRGPIAPWGGPIPSGLRGSSVRGIVHFLLEP